MRRAEGLVETWEGSEGMRRKSEEPKEMSARRELGCREIRKETDSESAVCGYWRPSKEDCCEKSGKRSREVLKPRWSFFPAYGIPWGWFRSRTLMFPPENPPESAFQNQCL